MTKHGWFILIGLTCGTALLGTQPAEAQIKWKGFSELCFEGTFTSGPVSKGELTVKLSGLTVKTACLTLGTQQSCQPGLGNAGDLTITADAFADPTKEKGTISVPLTCIPLDKWDHHYLPDGITPAPQPEVHQHTCNPLSNVNKVEIEDSARIDSITTEWVLTNNGKIIQQGNQECFWPGTVDPNTCLPVDNPDGTPIDFVCPIDVVSGKGKK
jgi:hypothetical protein